MSADNRSRHVANGRRSAEKGGVVGTSDENVQSSAWRLAGRFDVKRCGIPNAF